MFERIVSRLYEKVLSARSKYQLRQFADYGDHVSLGHGGDFIPSHIHCGHHVHIGPHASFMASIAHIYIGNYVTFGPFVTIRGGNHRTDVIGKHVYEVKDDEKLPENDKDVIIEDGVWVGCNVIILKGVTIGKGAIVGAGAVVTKDVPPYSVVCGNPAKVIKKRFSDDEIVQHESMLRGRGVD